MAENHQTVTFQRPPLDEVVIGVQFDRDVADDALALADYWPRIRKAFPKLEKQPALPKAVEEFEKATPGPPQIEFLTSPPSPRYWFVSTDDTRLVQVQADRLLYNWRKRAPEQEYPRYRLLRDEFKQHLTGFLSSLPSGVEPGLAGGWCEVSYINHFEAWPQSGHGHRPLSDFLRLVAGPELARLPKPEDTQFQERYVLRDQQQRPMGRFYVSSVPAFRASTPIHVVTLLVRLKPAAGTADGVVGAFDQAHGILVESFRDITTEAAHEQWGLVT